MSTASLFDALDQLNEMVTGLEAAITKLEQRPKVSGGKRRENQMDLFGGGAPAASATPAVANVDIAGMSKRIDHVISKIQSVLQGAA